MHRGSATALMALLIPATAWAGAVSGTVVDPQGAVVVGAQVVLTCGRDNQTLKTDSQGRFVFARPARPAACTLSVVHPGFARFEGKVREDSGEAVVRLELARAKQIVTVSAHGTADDPLTRLSLSSVTLSSDDLKIISKRTRDVIGYAKAIAGASIGPDVVYVDGLPTSVLPPAELISRLTVNADPFSAEFADGDLTHIDITTRLPDRKFRLNLGGASLGAGGGSPLASGSSPRSHSGAVALSGPVPRFPVVFSLRTNLSTDLRREPVMAVPRLGESSSLPNARQTVPTGTDGGSAMLNLGYARAETFRTNFSYTFSNSGGWNVGAGGLTLPEAAWKSQLNSREARWTFTKSSGRLLYRGGLVASGTDSGLWANSQAVGLVVVGSFVSGGAGIANSALHRTNWTWKAGVEPNSSRRFWQAGAELAHSSESEVETPNRAGVFQFDSLQDYNKALAGIPAGTWFGAKGNGSARYASATAASFVQGELFRSEDLIIKAGVRGDYQTGAGVLLSPRLSAVTLLKGFILRAGGGEFVQNWSADTMTRAVLGDAAHLENILVPNSLPPEIRGGLLAGAERLTFIRIAPGLTRPRNWMLKWSVERPLGALTSGLEYTWTDGEHLLGSRRLPDEAGWIDLLESNRLMRRGEFHARLSYRWRRQRFVAHYQWVRARDNTDGPFSFPEDPADLRREWAPMAGLSPRTFTLVSNLRLPAGVSLTMVGTARNASPYNVTTGLDRGGDGLFNDRGGRPRNSGRAPGTDTLALYGYRRVALPVTLGGSKEKLYLDVGVQADNLLGNKNYLSFGSVLSSPLYGKPLGTLPGRSFRLWFNFDR